MIGRLLYAAVAALFRFWPLTVVVFAGTFVPSRTLSFGNQLVEHALEVAATPVVGAIVALIAAFSPTVKKWQVFVIMALALLSASEVWAKYGAAYGANPPASVIAAYLVSLAIIGYVLVMPEGSIPIALRRDIANLKASFATAKTGAHGTARFMRSAEARALYNINAGLIVGRVEKDVLFDDKQGHAMIIGGSNSRKTSNFVIPTVLTYPGNLVVLDPKGEVAAVTARARRERGDVVAIIDHAKPAETAYVNVLDWLDPTLDSFQSDVATVAAQLYEQRGSHAGSSQFFEATARMLIEYALLEMYRPDRETARSLRGVRMLMSTPAAELKTLLAASLEVAREQKDAAPEPWQRVFWAALADRAGSFAESDDETFANVLSSANAETKWLSDPSLANTVCGGPEGSDTSRAISSSLITKAACSVYACIAPQVLIANPAYARLLLGVWMSRIIGQPTKSRDTLFMLDEAPRLGRADLLLKVGLEVGRAYGVRVCYVGQSIGSMTETLGENAVRSWLDSARLVILLSTGDEKTARLFSEKVGTTTVSTLTNNNHNMNEQLTQRKLMTPDEIMSMPLDQALVFAMGQPALKVGKVFYKEIPALDGKYDANPYD